MGIRNSVAHADRSSNASSAKIIGVLTIIAAFIQINTWGAISAILLASAGALLVFGAGDELRRMSKRYFGLFVGYWALVMFGVGIGVA